MFISYEIQGDIVPGSSKFKFDIVDVGFSLLEYSICNLFFLQCLVLVLSCLYNAYLNHLLEVKERFILNEYDLVGL